MNDRMKNLLKHRIFSLKYISAALILLGFILLFLVVLKLETSESPLADVESAKDHVERVTGLVCMPKDGDYYCGETPAVPFVVFRITPAATFDFDTGALVMADFAAFSYPERARAVLRVVESLGLPTLLQASPEALQGEAQTFQAGRHLVSFYPKATAVVMRIADGSPGSL